ncbi:MAG: GNAT family N-acetyltransferase [Blastocatellia bacterium]|nr:GNAT family N-acetyltransferase [Blastocatellia bacterium]
MANEKLTRRAIIDATAPPDASRRAAGDGAAHEVRMSVLVIDDLTALEKYIPAWEDLAADTIEPNAFYEPWMMLPAIRAFKADQRLQLALVLAHEPSRSFETPLLCGIFPLEQQNHYQGLSRNLPFKTLRLWKHKYCYLCTPLVRAGYGPQVVAAFFDWLDAGSHNCSLMEFRFIAGDGPFSSLLIDYFERHAKLHYISTYFLRALFRPTVDVDIYLCAALSVKHRKTLRRQEKQLSAIGRLEYDALTQDDDVGVWIEEFLQLEAGGWKGRENSAIASTESDRTYFRSIAKEAFRRGRLSMLALRLDGRPIAYKCDFLTGRGLFTFRIAFDENYARNSPGMLLEIENVRRLHALSQIEWVDSCTDPSNFMFNRLWLARRPIQDVVIGAGKSMGDWVVAAIPLLKLLNRKLLCHNVVGQSEKASE